MYNDRNDEHITVYRDIRMGMGRVFIIAEAGVNHNGCLRLAKELVDIALNAGADAVKFQTFIADKLSSRSAAKAEYQQENTGTEESALEMLRKLQLPFSDFVELKKYCDKVGIMFLSTPFDDQSADFLDELVPIFKIPSGEITNIPFLIRLARKNKPIILSTGMSDLQEVELAVKIIQHNQKCRNDADFPPLSLLHCINNYPAAFRDVNLNAIRTMRQHFDGVNIGYSDHTPGIEAAVAAVALGAGIIEKHFTLDKNLEGPDHKASLEPAELHRLVEALRNVEAAMGSGEKIMAASETEVRKVVRRSLAAACDLHAGEILTEDMIVIKRPGTGISPVELDSALGRKLKHDMPCDSIITWEDLKRR